ncbi:hypothetical protein U3516DRAFT_739006 [Neocallimastix sp. 'constans']
MFWAYIRKNGTNLSRCLSYIQIVNNMASVIPDDSRVGGMMYFKSLFKVVERRRQNDKACKVPFLNTLIIVLRYITDH